MVTLIDLKKAKMTALKEHNSLKQGILSMAISYYQKSEIDKRALGKEMTEADMVSILNKIIKELEDEKTMYLGGNRVEEANNSQAQIDVIKAYLPTMMSEEEIRKVIEGLEDKSLKSVMVAFKTNYAGKADMSLVSRIAKSYQA
ncbi:MAG: GatB/YqeY domain-containing protein [Bacilli bacterium]